LQSLRIIGNGADQQGGNCDEKTGKIITCRIKPVAFSGEKSSWIFVLAEIIRQNCGWSDCAPRDRVLIVGNDADITTTKEVLP
jgi:hypothetical protein